MVDEDELLQMQEMLARITTTKDAIMEYAECIADNHYVETTGSLQAPTDNHTSNDERDTYTEAMQLHEQAKAKRRLETNTYMEMLVKKFGQDLPTLGWNEHNTWTMNDQVDGPPSDTQWHVRYEPVPKQVKKSMTRSQSAPHLTRIKM